MIPRSGQASAFWLERGGLNENQRAPRRSPAVGLSRLGVLSLMLVVIGLLQFWPDGASESSEKSINVSASIPAIYALPARNVNLIRNPDAVARALSFLSSLQPTGTYILTSPGKAEVVPMDLAHAVIALTKVGQTDRAKSAMLWLYGHMTTTPSGSHFNADIPDFSGSWSDSFAANGTVTSSSRGRGEAVGMALIATYTVWSEDPGFVTAKVGDYEVIDLVRLSVGYLTQSAMQHSDGCFAHSPDYQVSFNEECARMSVGLQLASRMLSQSGDKPNADIAAMAADRGIDALRRQSGLSQGMAYDYYAMAIWGLGTRDDARTEVTWAKSTGLIGANGVRNWDWQLSKATTILSWLRWWTQSQTIAPSETFDYAIASVSAGDVSTALDLERRWLPRQRSDGSFADSYILGLRLGLSRPTSYAVSRFLLLESLLTSVVGSS